MSVTAALIVYVKNNEDLSRMAIRIVTKSPGVRIERNLREWLGALGHGIDISGVDMQTFAVYWLREASVELSNIGRLHALLRECVLLIESSVNSDVSRDLVFRVKRVIE